MSSEARVTPAAHSPATYSKCAVSPRITAPMHTTASTVPDCANRLATSGSSNAPGTHATVTSAAPWSRSAFSAPAHSGSVTSRLKRAATIANRMPVASSAPSCARVLAHQPPPSSRRRVGLGIEAEQVAELVLLGAQVRDVLGGRHGLHRHPLDDLEAVALDAAVLRRVVRHQPHRRDAEVDEDLRADAVLARVGREAELEVGLDGVAALVLQRVRAQLVAEPDAAAFVAAQVHDDAVALLGDALPSPRSSCGAAVAAHRAEHVAGEALGVHAHEHVLVAGDLAAHEREVLHAVEQRLEHVRGEVAVLRRDPRLRHPPHELLAVAAVADEVGDREQHAARARPRTRSRSGRRCIVPSSLTISDSTPAG